MLSVSSVAGALTLAIAFTVTSRSTTSSARRLAAVLGVTSLVPLLLLGASWPSPFTVAALIALPAAVLLLASIARPSLMQRRALRAYLLIAVFLSPMCLLFQTVWLAR